MGEVESVIREHLRVEGESVDDVSVAELLGQLGDHSVVDGPDDVRDALESLRESGAGDDDGDGDSGGGGSEQSREGVDDAVLKLADADPEPFEECVAVIEDIELLREYVAFEVETKTRKERVATANQRIDNLRSRKSGEE